MHATESYMMQLYTKRHQIIAIMSYFNYIFEEKIDLEFNGSYLSWEEYNKIFIKQQKD